MYEKDKLVDNSVNKKRLYTAELHSAIEVKLSQQAFCRRAVALPLFVKHDPQAKVHRESIG